MGMSDYQFEEAQKALIEYYETEKWMKACQKVLQEEIGTKDGFSAGVTEAIMLVGKVFVVGYPFQKFISQYKKLKDNVTDSNGEYEGANGTTLAYLGVTGMIKEGLLIMEEYTKDANDIIEEYYG